MYHHVARIALLAIIVGGSCLASARAFAEGRVALVIGNSAYAHATALAHPANDALDVSQSLRRLGFKVTTLTDVNFDAFRQALIAFGRAARNADMAVLFYAGHGMEMTGENWLVPVDAELKSDIDIGTEAIGLRTAMLAVQNAKQLGLVILDACRNNPFALKSNKDASAKNADFGLAPVEPTDNVLVAYAARDGTTASDGAGRNSPYTTALLHNLETPGLEVDFLFRNVRDDVMNATNEEQQPFVYGSLSHEEIFFKEGPAAAIADSSDVAPDPGEIAWSFLRSTSDPDTLRRFVDRFPSSARLTDAKARIATLMEQPEAPSSFADQTYALASLEDSETERLTRQVTRRIRKNTPAVEEAWNIIKGSKDTRVIRRFVDRFPSMQRRVVAQQHLREMGQELAVPQAPHNLIIRAATDPNVLQCYRRGNINAPGYRPDDLDAPECQVALSRFPDIWRYTFDFRFRFELCKSLGDGCNRNMMHDAAALQSVALFDPKSRSVASAGPNGPIGPNAPGPNGPIGPNPPGNPLNAPVVKGPGGPATPASITLKDPGGMGPASITIKDAGPKFRVLAKTSGGGGSGASHSISGHHVSAHHISAHLKTGGGMSKFSNVKIGNFTSTPTIKNHVSLTGVKLGTIKTSTITTSIKTPTIKTPTIRTPTAKVPTIRVPTIAVHITTH